MAGKIRFYLDEHVPRAVATGLRMRGIDVLTAQEAGLLEAPDADHLALAMHQGRMVFTQDADFLRMHAQARGMLVSLTLVNKPPSVR